MGESRIGGRNTYGFRHGDPGWNDGQSARSLAMRSGAEHCVRPDGRLTVVASLLVAWFVAAYSAGAAAQGPRLPSGRAGDRGIELTRLQVAPPVSRPVVPAGDEPTEATPPRPASALPDIFGPDQVRLPSLPEARGPLGTTPRPDVDVLRKFDRFVDRTIDPENTLDVVIGRPRVLVLKEIPVRVQLEDPDMVRMVQLLENKQISFTGLRVGTTILNLWFGPADRPEDQTVLSYLIRVVPDPEARQRLERVYDALADEINRLFPNSVVRLSLAGDKLVVSGQAKDVVEATQILRIVSANAPGQGGGAGGPGGRAAAQAVAQIPLTNVSELGVDPATGNLASASTTGVLPTLGNYQLGAGYNVVNLLRIPGEQQVMLRVTVAEVNRSAARTVGVNWSVKNSSGAFDFINATGRITSNFRSPTGGGGSGSATLQGSNNLFAFLDNGRIFAAINALRTLNFARTLAEPDLTTTNGQPASFQAGGRFPVPVVTGATFSGLQGVTFIPFGVQLSFTPYVTDKDRIRLVVNSEVSTRDLQASATIGATNVPGLTTRNFTTTVELREGQTLAVAGLIQNSYGGSANRVPWLGDLPVVGRLGASDTSSYSEQELVILVTPVLVHPYDDCSEVPPLPGSDIFEPGDVEFYLLGRLESRRPYDYRSTVRTDVGRMARYRHCEDLFIQGPHGHSDAPR